MVERGSPWEPMPLVLALECPSLLWGLQVTFLRSVWPEGQLSGCSHLCCSASQPNRHWGARAATAAGDVTAAGGLRPGLRGEPSPEEVSFGEGRVERAESQQAGPAPPSSPGLRLSHTDLGPGVSSASHRDLARTPLPTNTQVSRL